MSRPGETMRLGAFLMTDGHHVAAWRHATADAQAGSRFTHFRRLAQTAERAKFDMLFLADGNAIRNTDPDSLRHTSRAVAFEPLTLLSGLAAITTHIGLVATASTTYNEPYTLARLFASLDQVSGGRAGWNAVTSSSDAEAHNFNLEAHPQHADRYGRAEEFVDVVRGLWSSWDDDAFPRDKASGQYFEPDRLHVLNHVGPHFQVRGPLNVARSAQGHPVIVQAGASEPGKQLAARTAEVIFAAQITLDEAVAYYADVKGRMAKFGRSPESLHIMPGAFPVVGRTETEAQAKFDELQALIHPAVGLALLSNHLGGIDLSPYPIDGPVPDDLPLTNAGRSRQALLLDLARRENLTLRALSLRIAGARGHWQLVGTPTQIADALQERFEAYGADGFNIMPPTLPGGLDDFVELVLPELRRRGLVRTEYTGRTLRENLNLRHPAAARPAQAAE